MKCKYCNQPIEPVLWDSLTNSKHDWWVVVWICFTHGLLLEKDVVGSYLQMELF